MILVIGFDQKAGRIDDTGAFHASNNTLPQAQPGFKVDVKDERLYIDTWFAGMLNIEVHFSRR